MSTIIDLQIASDCNDIPSPEKIQKWLDTLMDEQQILDKEITVRIVDATEIQLLNQQYRGKNKPTNVLSFPFEIPSIDLPEEMETQQIMPNFLGDIVICAPVVEQEAKEQNKILHHHWAHMLIHGSLHLLGYDHIEDNDANEMEGIEIQVLGKLAIDDPYQNH